MLDYEMFFDALRKTTEIVVVESSAYLNKSYLSCIAMEIYIFNHL